MSEPAAAPAPEPTVPAQEPTPPPASSTAPAPPPEPAAQPSNPVGDTFQKFLNFDPGALEKRLDDLGSQVAALADKIASGAVFGDALDGLRAAVDDLGKLVKGAAAPSAPPASEGAAPNEPPQAPDGGPSLAPKGILDSLFNVPTVGGP